MSELSGWPLDVLGTCQEKCRKGCKPTPSAHLLTSTLMKLVLKVGQNKDFQWKHLTRTKNFTLDIIETSDRYYIKIFQILALNFPTGEQEVLGDSVPADGFYNFILHKNRKSVDFSILRDSHLVRRKGRPWSTPTSWSWLARAGSSRSCRRETPRESDRAGGGGGREVGHRGGGSRSWTDGGGGGSCPGAPSLSTLHSTLHTSLRKFNRTSVSFYFNF